MKKVLLAAFAATAMFAGCKKGGDEGATLSKGAFSVTTDNVVFDFFTRTSPNSEITVTSPDGSYSYAMEPADGAGWLAANQSGSKLTLSLIQRDETTAPEPVTLTITSGTESATVNVTHEWAYIHTLTGTRMAFDAVSENGRFIGGFNSDMALVVDATQLRNDENGTTIPFVPFGEHKPTLDADGVPVSTDPLVLEGTFFMHYIDNSGNPYTIGATPDGSIRLHYTTQGGSTTPYYKENGVTETLPQPTNYYVAEQDFRGTYPDVISADGNVILGRFRTYSPLVSCGWKKNSSGQYECFDVAPDVVEMQKVVDGSGNPILQDGKELYDFKYFPVNIPGGGISWNGKYISGVVRDRVAGGGYRQPFIFDVETGTTTRVTGVEASDVGPVATDDGLLFYSTTVNEADYTPYVFNVQDKTSIELATWVRNRFGIEFTQSDAGRIGGVSRDQKTICWYKNSAEGMINYVVVVR